MEAWKLNCCCFTPVKNPLFFDPILNFPFLFNPRRTILIPKTIRVSYHNRNKTFPIEEITSVEEHRRASEIKTYDDIRKETESILEWPSICSQLSAFASTAMGRARCRDAVVKIGQSREESERLLEQTKAAVLLPKALDFDGIEDVSEIVKAAVKGGLLMIPQLCNVERSVRAARGVFEQLDQVSDGDDRYRPLLDILQNCDFLTELADKIGFCIDCTLSTIPDQASTKLKIIRLERRKNAERLDSLLKEVSVKVFKAGGIDSPLVTRRRSRMCVGIKASHKSLLPEGIVLSVSSSGATYFMEPRGAVELNNMEVRLANSERAEELAILGFLSSEVAVSELKIRYLMDKILELDLACARGSYARWIDGVCPVFYEDHEKIVTDRDVLAVDIEGIRHPLLLEPSLRSLSSLLVSDAVSLELMNTREGSSNSRMGEAESPVPLDIKIGQATKVIVISGPNTGGKTATMKTLGLASIMSKAGVFLPAKNTPRLPWFDQILADIGDHQSLEHNLSTFSGHISRLCKIIDVVSEESLVLVDEIGSGTDPSEGVALSTSILLHLADCVNLALVTTHYGDLSRLKSIDSRFENAAMEFCIKTLQPTYRILWGSIGNSNALSIAKSIGFDQKVLSHAQEWVEKLVPDKQQERQGFLYQSLLAERNLLEMQAKEAASVLSEVKKLHGEIHSEAADLDRREDVLKAKEVHRRQQELKAARSRMDSVIKNFEVQLQNATTDQFGSILREAEAAISTIVATHSPSGDMLNQSDDSKPYIPRLGERVYVKGLGAKLAEVVKVAAEDDSVMVQYGKIKVRVKISNVRPMQRDVNHASNAAAPNVNRQGQVRFKTRPLTKEKEIEEATSFGPAVRTSKNTVDLRGLRAEEASRNLQIALSGCRSYGVLFVIHGMGTGVVKERALDILRNHPRVAKFEEESPMNYGCTVAYIK